MSNCRQSIPKLHVNPYKYEFVDALLSNKTHDKKKENLNAAYEPLMKLASNMHFTV